MSDLYLTGFERVLFPVWEGVIRGRPTLSLRKHLEQTQWRSRDELQAIQIGALRSLLRHAARNVPLYRERFAASGIAPESIHTVEDLAKVPLLTRDEAIDTRARRTATSGATVAVNKSTGGTTGQPMQFGYDLPSEHWRQAMRLRGWGWAGHRTGARTLHYWGMPSRPALAQRMKIGIDRMLKRELYVDCTQRSDEAMTAAARTIARFQPESLICFTQAAVDLARHILTHSLRAWESVAVLCCAERLFPDDRRILKEAFGENVFETYGCREVMLIGSECDRHDGLHLSVENLVVEVIVREHGTTRAARPGETGEVVITDLHNYAMPFIRYLNGDLAVAGPVDECACGRRLPRIASVEGRVADTLRDGNGGRVSGLMFNVIFTPLAADVRQFQAVQARDGSVTIKLVPMRPLDEKTREMIRKKCAEKLPGVSVKTEVVGEIPLSRSGKRQVTIVER
jgi:phenylacetate-CoA ligase